MAVPHVETAATAAKKAAEVRKRLLLTLDSLAEDDENSADRAAEAERKKQPRKQEDNGEFGQIFSATA
jgi:hypothetical protein